MNQSGKYIIYLFLGLFTTVAFMLSCSDGNGPDNLTRPADKISLSISFHSAQQTRAGSAVRGTEIDEESESKIYSLAVLVFKNGSGELDGSKFADRELNNTQDASDREDYKELNEIKEIELTSGTRDIYIIANAPDGYFSDVTNHASFRTKLENLQTQRVYGLQDGETPGDTPIGGEEPVDRYTNLVMTRSFIGLSIEGAEKQYLGYTEEELPDGATPLNEGNPVELVRLVARVAIQKIAFDLPVALEFEEGIPTSNYNQYIDTVFMINAKTSSTYFPGETGFTGSNGTFAHGNIPGYNFLKGNHFPGISGESEYVDYLSKPINFKEYDIENNQVPLWFYLFENNESETYPTGFVIGVKYQYKNPDNDELRSKKAYYGVVVNRVGEGSNDHNFIKRNNQYGIKVTIKRLGDYIGNYPKSADIDVLRAASYLSSQETDGVMEIEETVGTHLFPWTGDIYK